MSITRFSDYKNKWIESKKPHVAHVTYVMCENILKLYTSEIDYFNMRDITKSDIQKLINSRMDKPRTCKKIK